MATLRYFPSSIIAAVCQQTGMNPGEVVGWWHQNGGKLLSVFRYVNEHPGSSRAEIVAATRPPPGAPAGAQPVSIYLSGMDERDITIALEIGQAIALSAFSPVITPPVGVEVADKEEDTAAALERMVAATGGAA